MSSKLIALIVVCLGLAYASTSAQKLERSTTVNAPRFYADDPIWRDPDSRDIPPVQEMDLSKSYEFIVHTFGDPAKSDGPALNVNSTGEVPDSSWFTNRLGTGDLSIADVVKGPESRGGPAAGVWLVTGRPDQGITPKFTAHASIGNVEADFFEPWKWKTEYPNPAFVRMDAADAFWAASIVSRFTDDMIRAIVETGELSDPEAARTLGDIIIKRRDKVVAYWMTQTNPLDRFSVRSTPAQGTTLTFDNAALRLRLADQMATYHVTWTSLDNMTGWESPMGTTWNSASTSASVPYDAWGPKDPSGARYAVARIETSHPRFPNWRRPVVVTLRDRSGVKDVVGIERPTGVDK